ncbi:MAG: recombinase family protein [Thermoplasmata archaeon]|nr:MAG: recombinase family protein [Thermoplasmata archaeon]
MTKKQQLKPADNEYRCQRCWSEKDINLYPRSLFLGSEAKGFIILCEKCKGEAPQGEGNEDAFEDLFLRFASPKEFIQHYDAQSEAEALDKWCSEKGVDSAAVQVEEKGDKVRGDDTVEEGKDQQAPFGYELDDSTLKIINVDGEVVKQIFEEYLSGRTMESIARSLDNNAGGEGCGWGVGAVRDILKNPVYAGYDFKGSEAVKADHEPLIDRELFNNVQERIQRNIRNPRYRSKPLILVD